MLPEDDKTPYDWTLPELSKTEYFLKKPIRRVLYPFYLQLIQNKLRRRFDKDGHFSVDKWYWGHRGLDYDALRRRVNNIEQIQGKSVLIAGCGTGKDIPTWLRYRPSELIAVDFFNYERAWNCFIDKYSKYSEIKFVQGDLQHLTSISDNSIDIIGSDAVFEHLRDLSAVLKEFRRILKTEGVLYATFGPLWKCWGGDHISGYDCIDSGFNHLLLNPEEYKTYLYAAGDYHHCESDGRTWVKENLFSFLCAQEYLDLIRNEGFKKIHLGFVIEPRAIVCLEKNQNIYKTLMSDSSMLDLVLAGMSIIFKNYNSMS